MRKIRKQLINGIKSSTYEAIKDGANLAPTSIIGVKDGKWMSWDKFLRLAKFFNYKRINLETMKLEK